MRVLDVMTCADGYGSGDVAPTQQQVMATKPAPILRSQVYKVKTGGSELCTVPGSLSLAAPNRRRRSKANFRTLNKERPGSKGEDQG